MSRKKSNIKLVEEIELIKDIPEKNLKKGDIATIVEYHPVSGGGGGRNPYA